jgi:hypothetical protein
LGIVEHAAARGVRETESASFRRFVAVLVATEVVWLSALGYLLAWLLG